MDHGMFWRLFKTNYVPETPYLLHHQSESGRDKLTHSS